MSLTLSLALLFYICPSLPITISFFFCSLQFPHSTLVDSLFLHQKHSRRFFSSSIISPLGYISCFAYHHLSRRLSLTLSTPLHLLLLQFSWKVHLNFPLERLPHSTCARQTNFSSFLPLFFTLFFFFFCFSPWFVLHAYICIYSIFYMYDVFYFGFFYFVILRNSIK